MCDVLPHFPGLIELFVHNVFYFHGALNHPETVEEFVVSEQGKAVDGDVSDGLLSPGDKSVRGTLQTGELGACKSGFPLC